MGSVFRTIIILLLCLPGWIAIAANIDGRAMVHIEELSGADGANYRLGPGDVTSITVEPVPEVSL